MGINNIKDLTIEEYNKYKDDDRFIHNINFAVSCCDEYGNLKYKKAMTEYSIAEREFIVNDEQIKTGKKEYNRRKQEILNNIKTNELCFVGMGMDFNPVDNEHIGNHRIRTDFKDNNGVLCFVEFGTAINTDFLMCNYALKDIKKNVSEWQSLKHQDETEKRVYLLENLRGGNIEYTKKNILKLVNDNFDTNFKDIKVFSYFINTDDYNSISKNIKSNITTWF